jgi:hypothetical protein
MKEVALARSGLFPLSILWCVFLLGLTGCGAPPAPPEQAVEAEEPGQGEEQASVEEANLAEPSPAPTADPRKNFGSIEQFPNLRYSVSEDLAPNGHAEVPLLETNRVENLEGEAPATHWAARVPATYEITLPAGAVVEQIAVQSTGGTTAFPECVVFLKAEGSDWKRPENLTLVREFAGYDDDGDMTRHVFSFTPQPASSVQIGFALGCDRSPQHVHVHDIDVFGNLTE